MDRRTARTISERGLVPCMNDTRWRELCEAIDGLPFPPAYQVKTLHEEQPFPPTIEPAPGYHGDWGKTPEASFGKHIEWIRVAPAYRRSVGRLLPHVIEDCTDELRALLHRLRITFVEENGFFVIPGYLGNR